MISQVDVNVTLHFVVESIIILIRYEDNIAVAYQLSFFKSHHKYQPYLLALEM